MAWNIPEGYQGRVEAIIGAQFDQADHIVFPVYTLVTVPEAKAQMRQFQLKQKQLRQIKQELRSEIKIVRSHIIKPMGRRGGLLNVFSSTINTQFEVKIDNIDRFIIELDRLIDTYDRMKLGTEIWIEKQRTNTDVKSVDRQPIPDDVQIFVWNRDGGKCVKCGSQEKLEYDHIIPFSKGGNNTARNLQLLCEECNRKKSNTIGG